MTLKKTSAPCHQGLTPPDSPTKETVTPQATVNELKHLFDVLEKMLLDLTNREPPNTPVFQDHCQTCPDIVQLKQLLTNLVRDERSSIVPLVAKPAQSFSSNEQEEKIQAAEVIDLQAPIRTTPDDFKSFEKWASHASTPQFKTVVETWDKEACKYNIDEPTDTRNDLDDHDYYVFVVRQRVDRKSEEVTAYIDIKSEGLRDILREVLHDIKAVSLMEDEPTIGKDVLFHFLPDFNKCAESMKANSDRGSTHRDNLELLIDHLKQTHAATSQRLDSMLEHNHITYDLLWALFKPGSYVYTTCFGTGEPRCVVFDAGEETTEDDIPFFKLECRFLDYDGAKFGETGIFLRILKFRGSKPIETLEAFPLHYHPNHQQVRKDLVGRGQKFRDLAGSHIQHCNGSAFFMNKGKPFKMSINCRVAVDAAFFHEMQPNYSRPRLQDIWAKNRDGISVIDIDTLIGRGCEREKERMKEDSLDGQELREIDFLIACPTVCCFSFKEKLFREYHVRLRGVLTNVRSVECAVGSLQDVQWSPESFDSLEIPSKTKTLLSSLAKSRLGLVPAVPFDDGIDGKGRGLNILLHGPTGVGKTFTVEATSERFHLPLYSISAGELAVDGGDSSALEQQLEHIFKIAKHFNAVLLLDEADAFLEQRTSYHGIHNRLVTIFLRKMEYYQGVLFLTTNRKIQFDEAILSRIHLTIKYEDLSREFRRAIWENQLSKACTAQGPAIVGHEELQPLSKSA
ncbi:ATPase AAA-type core [Penicillium riverlandense]|uniref:ATPase AAA-type core n=1 Tax=Penicillium riverlandense TaxID=1903569 RepID=UPI002547B552|nr:ATPase AAA-type core [Penicillium riverlandense]KAJ5808882.1 ATPase AAA-type core [Penicillium riverlandense]